MTVDSATSAGFAYRRWCRVTVRTPAVRAFSVDRQADRAPPAHRRTSGVYVALIIWWVCATVGGRNPGRRSPVRTAIGVLTLAVLASYASGMVHGWYAPSNVHQITDQVYDFVPVTVEDLTTKMMSAADRGLLSFGGWLGVVLLTVDGIRSWKDLEILVKWLTGLAAFVATLGIIQFATGFNIASLFQIPGLVANSDFGGVVSRSTLRRVSSTAVHPIEFGVVMAAIFPLALHRTIYNWRQKSAWVPTILIGVAIPISVSRSAILVVAIVLVILLLGWPPSWRRRAIVIAPAAIVGLRSGNPGSGWHDNVSIHKFLQ